MCRWLEVSKSGYYAWRGRPLSQHAVDTVRLTAAIHKAHADNWGVYGSPRMHVELVEAGHDLSLGRTARIMRKEGLQGVTRRKKRGTTRRDLRAVASADLVDRNFTALAPNRLWVADITYVPTDEGFAFVAGIQDVCSRFCVGWAVGATLHTSLITRAFEMAVHRREIGNELVHHSDHGCQYTSIAFTRKLKDAGIKPSMGSVGDCYDNAMAESFMGTIKAEGLAGIHFENPDQVNRRMFAFIEGFYNPRRRHTGLGTISPMEYERRLPQGAAASPHDQARLPPGAAA